MSFDGTTHNVEYGLDRLPPLVAFAVREALQLGFEFCVHPSIGRLLSVLCAGLCDAAIVGETGTGTGAGLGWMVEANPSTRFISVERDPARAEAARRVFANHRNVEVITGDAGELFDRGPFDLLVHDGGWGSGKIDPRRIDPMVVLRENGVMTIDDYAPMRQWPPMFNNALDQARIDWLTDERFLATEVSVTPELAVLVCRRRPPTRTSA